MHSRRVPGAIGQDYKSRRFWYFENSLYLYREQKGANKNCLTLRHLSWIITILSPPNLDSQLQNIPLTKLQLENLATNQDSKSESKTDSSTEKSIENSIQASKMLVFEEMLDNFDPNFKLEIICMTITDWQKKQFEAVLEDKECANFRDILNNTFLPFVRKLNVKLNTDPGSSSSPNFDYWDLPEFSENESLKWLDPTRISKI